jgi:maleamate amidohydrolase
MDMPKWDQFLTERDKLVFEKAGFGAQAGFGRRPVVLVIDVSYGFCGERPMPILEAIDEWHSSCGEEAWTAVDRTRELIAAARHKRIPIVYATGPDESAAGEFGLGRWLDKNPRSVQHASARYNEIVAPIAPRASDIMIRRSKPSVFFGSELASHLVNLGADTVITCGVSTSGCVRATVLDGFSFNYRMVVVEDCTFDRCEASHWMSLFDMHQKYADVVPLSEVAEYLGSVRDDLFVDRMAALSGARD